MAFKKGDKKPENSGRQKGTKNKLNLGVQEKLEQLGVDCVSEIIRIAQTTEDEQLRLTAYKELLKYVYPQRKAVEMSGEVDMPVISIKGL